jgi:hypothetical protein
MSKLDGKISFFHELHASDRSYADTSVQATAGLGLALSA